MNDLTAGGFGDREIGNPFAATGAGATQQQSVGGVAVAARENTEVLAMVMSAKRFPRDVIKCADKILTAFCRPSLAESSQYQFSRGGTDIVGPSIRAAEAMAQQWGNMSAGWRELSRVKGADGVGVSEVEAFCIDYESNSRESIQFVVRHWRDTRAGGYALKEERDIYELCANQAARRKRACILAQLPGDITEAAMDQAAATLKARADVSAEGQAKLVEAFGALGVDRAAIEKRIQRKLDAIQPAHIVMLKRVYASIRDGMSLPADWFEGWQAGATASEAPRKGDKVTLDSLALKSKKTSPAGAVPSSATNPLGLASVDEAARSYARFADLVLNAADAETAGLILDASRDELTEELQAELVSVWRGKFGKT